jgi:hypothetical protein
MEALPPLLALLLAAPALSGCIGAPPNPLSQADDGPSTSPVDDPLAVPETDWYNASGCPETHYRCEGEAPFHSLDEVQERIRAFEERRPDLVDVQVVGRTLEDRPIHRIVVTDEAEPGDKPVAFLDGGHHADEIAGTEMSLYLVDLLLDNHDRNATVRNLLDSTEVWTVPLVNPDGYVRQQRGNALGVNLNRNYDVDWGNPTGSTNPVMGTLAHETGQPMPSVPVVAENAGDEPFSEPETQTVRDQLRAAGDNLAFYLTYHTPTHALIAPWAASDPPFEMPDRDRRVHERVLDWTEENTEYQAGKAQWGNFSAGLPYSASGTSMDWAYMRHGVPSFTLELEFWWSSAASDDYPDRAADGQYDGLDYWMRASLPIPMYLLANVEDLARWEVPDDEPPLPPGVPPEPTSS